MIFPHSPRTSSLFKTTPLAKPCVAAVMLGWLVTAAFLPAAEPLEYLGRFGLFAGPEFTRNDGFQYTTGVLSNPGYLSGNALRYNGSADAGQASWVASAATGITLRIGLFSGSEFTHAATGTQISEVAGVPPSGYLLGHSQRYIGSRIGTLNQAAWVANASTGVTTRIGLFSGFEFTRNDGVQGTVAKWATQSGYVSGSSERYNGFSSLRGEAAWVATASTGTTTRIGLFSGSEFTRSDGGQFSESTSLTESGYALGSSTRYNGGTSALGQAAWVVNAATGSTTRVGLFSGPEFTHSDGTQFSKASSLSESGYLYGHSDRYNGTSSLGQAAWGANASTGATTRIGFFSGPEYTRNDGFQFSEASKQATSQIAKLTEAGYLRGVSHRYNGGSTQLGQAAWVASAATGTTTRIGFFSGPEYSRNDGFQSSSPDGLTESGYLRGTSQRFNGGSTQLGQAAWVANASTGATTRIGLYSGPEFTSSNGTQHSTTSSLMESGYVGGESFRYNGGSTQLGQAVWVAHASTGATTRIGLYSGPEFTSSNGTQNSAILSTTESGFLRGETERYLPNGAQSGMAAWVADAATGVTTRLGFYSEPEFTRADGSQLSGAVDLTETGYLQGYSLTDLGSVAWVADASTGITQKVGLYDSVHTSDTGVYISEVGGLTANGIAWGSSIRYNGDSTEDGQTGWLYDISSGQQVIFDFSERASDGYANSGILGVTESGIALGSYWLYDALGGLLGNRAFIWSEELGIRLLSEEFASEMALDEFLALSTVQWANESGYLYGYGSLDGQPATNQGVYAVYVAPEPGRTLLLLVGAAACLMRRRRRESFVC